MNHRKTTFCTFTGRGLLHIPFILNRDATDESRRYRQYHKLFSIIDPSHHHNPAESPQDRIHIQYHQHLHLPVLLLSVLGYFLRNLD
mmetsp:Transcript_205/g.258  ORF Transcript_205/g.258 Transcript_205/m.258 type:complete len:87 (+) Transcript_205:207-467(+)